MESAAELEDGTEKSAVTPGPLSPARELLGEMLLEMHEPSKAVSYTHLDVYKRQGHTGRHRPRQECRRAG